MKKRAGAEAEALGFEKGSEKHTAMCEAARKAVLKNEAFRDATLSEKGWRQALGGKKELVRLARGLGLRAPAAVLVSPLQRTLQTAATMFPNCRNVHVCEALRERRTGLPCDEPQSANIMASHSSFAHMQWGKLLAPDDASEDGRRSGAELEAPMLEDAPALRRRTEQLIDELRDRPEESVCVIGHKGYLRELERGPLGRPAAKEFDTCEVRVYDVLLNGDGTMVAMLRYCKEEHGVIADPEPMHSDGGYSEITDPCVEKIALANTILANEDHPCEPLELILAN